MLIDFHTHNTQTAEGVIAPSSFGFHPWTPKQISAQGNATVPADCEHTMATLKQMLTTVDMVGECGLDRLCDTPWEVQKRLFEEQLIIAEEMQKPVVIHCVRAMEELIAMRKHYNKTAWVMHGFAGGVEQAKQLIAKGISISVGAALIDERHTKLRQAVQMLGVGAFFLETDEAEIEIGTLYRVAAELLQVEENLLEEAIYRQYIALCRQNQDR